MLFFLYRKYRATVLQCRAAAKYNPFASSLIPFIWAFASFLFVGLPDPFAVVTVDGDQTHTTTVMKKTLNPYWNESFEV